MAKSILLMVAIASVLASVQHCAVLSSPVEAMPIKIFNYQGNLPPIKDDRTGEIIGAKPDEGNEANKTQEAEKMCWDLIVEQTGELPIGTSASTG